MQLDPEAFNEHLANMGAQVRWSRACACPCVNQSSGAAQNTCENCRGKGWFWILPVTCVTAFSGQKVQQQWAQFGKYETGDIVLTIPSNSAVYAIGPYDRVRMMQGSSPFSSVLMAGEQLKFPILSVERAYANVGGKIEEVTPPGVDGSGWLSWGTDQPTGQYSITGRRAPEYYCLTDFAQDRAFHGGAALPRRVVLRKFDLFAR